MTSIQGGDGEGEAARRSVPDLVFGAVLAVASFVVMWPGIRFPFVFDDWKYLNETQQADWWHAGIADPTSPVFRPVLLVSIGVQQLVFGDHPLLFHIVAFLGLLGIGWLMHRFVLRLGIGSWGARAAAAMIVLHTAMVWPIAWTSAISSLMSMALALGVCLRLARAEPSKRDVIVATALFVVALFTREIIAGLPLIVFLFRAVQTHDAPELTNPKERIGRALRPTLPLWVVLAAYGVFRLLVGVDATGGPYEQKIGREAVDNLWSLMRTASAAPSLPFSGSQRLLAAAIWFALVVVLVIAAARGRLHGLVGLIWFFVGVAPVVGLFRQLMVPYYVDFALLGLALAVGVAFDEVTRWVPSRVGVLVGAACIVALVGSGVREASDSLGPLQSKRACADRLIAQVERDYPDPDEGSTIVVKAPGDCNAELSTVDGDLFRVLYDDPDLEVEFVAG